MADSARALGVGIRHRGTGKAEAEYSPYMEAVYEAIQAAAPMRSFCPFGCDDDNVDEYGRCYHVIGYSPDGKHVEPLERSADGQLRVQVRKYAVKNGRRVAVLDKVSARRHVLVPITTSFIVYEDRPMPEGWLPPDELADDATDEPAAPEAGDDNEDT